MDEIDEINLQPPTSSLEDFELLQYSSFSNDSHTSSLKKTLSLGDNTSDLHSLLRFFEKRKFNSEEEEEEEEDELEDFADDNKYEKFDAFQFPSDDNLLGRSLDGEDDYFAVFDDEFEGEFSEDLDSSGLLGNVDLTALQASLDNTGSVSPVPLSYSSPSLSFLSAKSFKVPETDEATKKKVESVLASEFDREIEYRLQDLDAIEYQLQFARQILAKLNSCVGYKGETNGKYWKSRSKGKSKQTNPIYVQTADKTFLKMVCPECDKSTFSSKSELINHCKVNHKLKFSSFEDAAKKCGVPVDENQVPQDDPSRKDRSSISAKKRKHSDSATGSPVKQSAQSASKKSKHSHSDSHNDNLLEKSIRASTSPHKSSKSSI